MDHSFEAYLGSIHARPLQRGDIERLRSWRNDAELARYLRQMPPISKEMQAQWFESYLREEGCYFFAVEETEEFRGLIGSVALYNFRGKTAECGRILFGNKNTRGKGLARTGIALCLGIGFERLGLERIDLTVFEDNIPALVTYEKIGFKRAGKVETEGKTEIYMTLTLENLKGHTGIPF